MLYDVIIIGAGASGLTCAIEAAKQNKSVLVIERLQKAGKKILATGNGKCNMANSSLTPSCYHSDDLQKTVRILGQNPYAFVTGYFGSLGVQSYQQNGYFYPSSNQAATIVSALLLAATYYGVAFQYDTKIASIQHKTNRYLLTAETSERFECKNVVLACGGKAQPKLGSDGSGLQLASELSHTIIPPFPALTALHSSLPYCKELKGVRQKGIVTLFVNGHSVGHEIGEIQFTDYGLSGIAVFNLSHAANEALSKKATVSISLHLISDVSEDDFLSDTIAKKEHCPYMTCLQYLNGYLPEKLASCCLKACHIKQESFLTSLNKAQLHKLYHQITKFDFPITHSNSFDASQVMAGGVALHELTETLESRIHKGLYIIGELVNVDGICGGYNLMWAFRTGYIAGTNL